MEKTVITGCLLSDYINYRLSDEDSCRTKPLHSYFNKGCPFKSVNLDYERGRDDGSLLILTFKLGIISAK